MEDAIRQAIVSHFPSAEVTFENDPEYGRIVGTVVLDDYEQKTQLERQNELWTILRQDLSQEQLLKIGLLMTLTHNELQAFN